MNKEEYLTKIAEAANSTSKEANHFLNAFVQVISDVLSSGDTLRLNGLGAFSVKVRAARAGRNPKTGEAIQIRETKVAHFSPAKEIKDRLNKQS